MAYKRYLVRAHKGEDMVAFRISDKNCAIAIAATLLRFNYIVMDNAREVYL